MEVEPTTAPPALSLTRVYQRLVVLIAAVAPLAGLAYLAAFQNPDLRFASANFHEAAIAVAMLQTGFIAYVAWRCYLSSGERLQRWLTLAFLGFGLVYAPHGLFTVLADRHMWLFLVYGPVSRLTMAVFIVVGVLSYGQAAHPPAQRRHKPFWYSMIAALLVLDVVVGSIALTWPESPALAEVCGAVAGALGLPVLAAPMQMFRLVTEVGALLCGLAGAAFIVTRRMASPLMGLTAIALVYWAQASLAFVIAKPWSHAWWLGHLVSATGFTVLSYGVIQAFHTTRAFSQVFSQEEVMQRLQAAKHQAEAMAAQLQSANESLAILAATDALTGLANRRHFMERAEAEVARARRSGQPLCLLALDLDHFKHINDHYGHAVGDQVLQRFARLTADQLRTSDLIGRLGGEEFVVLLPEQGLASGFEVAERIRAAAEAESIETGRGAVAMTVSVGVAEFDGGSRQLSELLQLADQRMYAAKQQGRNRVVSQPA